MTYELQRSGIVFFPTYADPRGHGLQHGLTEQVRISPANLAMALSACPRSGLKIDRTSAMHRGAVVQRFATAPIDFNDPDWKSNYVATKEEQKEVKSSAEINMVPSYISPFFGLFFQESE
jgi:hypothetical protein